MAQCNNCKVKLGCSCQKRTASDGKSCCAKCVGTYEQNLKQNTSETQPGVILSVKAVQKD